MGLSPDERAMSPFEHREEIAGVEALDESGDTAGARVRFTVVAGLTAERLQRFVDCHLARNAALGHVVPEMPDCPLVPRGITAKVVSANGDLAVEIRSDDQRAAQESLNRARRLIGMAGR